MIPRPHPPALFAHLGAGRPGYPSASQLRSLKPTDDRRATDGLARNDHPETAHAAAAAIAPHKLALHRKLILALRESVVGLTDEELQFTCRMPANTERPRRVELCDDGTVCDSGRKRKTASGRSAIVWTLTTEPETKP